MRKMANIENIVGKYLNLSIEDTDYRIYFEEVGEGIPLLCLHTAGADSRQFRHLLNDQDLAKKYRILAFDLPYHGRSNPPANWWESKYELTSDFYVKVVRSFWNALEIKKPVVTGCSMGGAIVLRIAYDYQEEVRGIIGLETTGRGHGRENSFLYHPAVHGGELVATYTYGLNSPNSPEENKRENWWYYAQSGPGVYAGDVYFYCNEHDAFPHLEKIDTNNCKVALLAGEYDYSATPEETEKVHKAIKGSWFKNMRGMGHFPMIENYPDFRPYFIEALNHVSG